ncbi:hypothetical protein ANTHELSMS3_03141 [Antarctobacter heliothermus]|uniref:Uncharacterized protein n=2 Tax=Antarctobacter heliothermus TaxID=74033 RepID=A0A222E6K6_9RHOB|nr:DUF1826 domain-containing protein [Antarctobacter heliothermus]ASP21792.1 hypothetical protein ANTHELSMS3_03141 [Antarctobacter heliothermus]
MTQVFIPLSGGPSGVRVVDRPEALSASHHPDCTAAIWHPRPQPASRDWIDTRAAEGLPTERMVVRPTAVRKPLFGIFATAGAPDCEECDWLIDDATSLAASFAGLMRVSYLRLRFDVVTTNVCRKFHIDAVKARHVQVLDPVAEPEH